ncbi:MAG: SOUL heme-binding protein [Rhodopirellula sp.]|nr:SOUL heme-binding protein [Rhodopirellula sp.]
MAGKNMVYMVFAAVSLVLLYAGWKLTSRNAYESAKYSVVKIEENIEVRAYPDLMMATTDYQPRLGNNGSFGRLFQYISGGNKSNQKIAMTTPVIMQPGSSREQGAMSFVLPEKVAGTNIPQPESKRVTLNKRPEGLFAVIRFSGRDEQELIAKQSALLKEWILDNHYEMIAEPEFAGYDPPWTPAPLRRNEILIRIQLSTQP